MMTSVNYDSKVIYDPTFQPGNQFPVLVRWARGVAGSYFLSHHADMECHLFKRGRGFYFIQGKKVVFNKNSLILIAPNQIHMCMPEHGSYIEKVTLFVMPGLVKKLPFSEIHSRLALTEKEATLIQFIFDRIHEEMQAKDPFWNDLIRLRLSEFAFLVRRINRRPAPPAVQHPLVTQILEYLDKHYAESLKISEVAGQFGYSEGHLMHLFKRFLGFGIKQYIMQLRIMEARRMLEQQPQLKVSAIAEMLGFYDFPVFDRYFKSVTGTTPTACRRILHQ